MNKYRPHVWVIPEDDADRQIVVGFQNHESVNDSVIQLAPPAGGWIKVLDVFEAEYIPALRSNQNTHVVMLIDFDNVEGRGEQILQRIPEDIRSRVFYVGSKDEPEALKRELGKPFETIGSDHNEDFCRRSAFDLAESPTPNSQRR